MKKAQAWGIDLVVAVMIFLSGIIFFYLYSLNYSGWGELAFEKVERDAKLVSDSLMGGGFPSDWDEENVVRIGIVDDGNVNQTKLERFYFLVVSDYERTKRLFSVSSNYYVSFKRNVSVNGSSVGEFGSFPDDYENLAKSERVVVYSNKVNTMEVFAWS